MMTGTMQRMLAAFDRLLNYFIPPAIAAERDVANRARMFLVSHMLGPFIGNVVPIALYIFVPNPGFEVATLALSITAFWLFPFLLKAGVPYNPLALISVQNLIFCILWSCYFYGGVTSPTLPWVLTIPLLAFFYLGSARGMPLIVTSMVSVNFLIFSVFYTHGYGIRDDLPIAELQALGLVSTVAASLYVAMMALYYAKVLESQTELEAEMRDHQATAAELRRATEEADRASAAKAEFLARMSHELRTPLNAVIGYSQILLEEADEEGNEQELEDLAKIHDAGQHLLQLVNEILDLSKIEAGKMQLNPQMTDLAGLLMDVICGSQASANKNGNRLTCDLDAGLGVGMIDAQRLRNIVEQLVDNALKFTHEGQVALKAARIRDGEGDVLTIDVVDTGIGIARDRISGLFEKFTAEENFSTSRYGGTGLGLALSLKMCTLMGGDISVESNLGRGSRFSIRLPLAADEPIDAHDAPALAPLAHDRDAAVVMHR